MTLTSSNAGPWAVRATQVRKSVVSTAAVVAVAALTLFAATPAAYAGPLDPIVMPDAALRACVNAEITGNGPTDPITEADAATVTSVGCGQDTVSDLTGLEMLTSLEVLDLNQNSVTDISPPTILVTLRRVYLALNSIGDMTPVLGLPGLLKHEVKTLDRIGAFTFYSCDPEEEQEANWLAGCLLLPRSLPARVVGRSWDADQLAAQFGVSREMVNYRARATGVDRQRGGR